MKAQSKSLKLTLKKNKNKTAGQSSISDQGKKDICKRVNQYACDRKIAGKKGIWNHDSWC